MEHLFAVEYAYPPSLLNKAHKINRSLNGAFQSQEPFTGANPLLVFTFLITFRCACDAAGLTHGQALPLLAFRLSGAAKKSLSSALNTQSGSRKYALRTYGDAINWLPANYATNSVLSDAYVSSITMTEPEIEAPTVFGLLVESKFYQLDGLFDVQHVRNVFINGLSEIIRSHVCVLDGQLQHHTLAEIVTAAQMYWEETKELQQSLKPRRTQLGKVSDVPSMLTRPVSVDRPFPVTQPPTRSRSPPSPSRSDEFYHCNQPKNFSAQCAEPYRPRESRPAATHAVHATSASAGTSPSRLHGESRLLIPMSHSW